MDAVYILNIALPAVFVVVGLALVWFLVELVRTLKTTRKTLTEIQDQLKPTLEHVERITNELQPAIERVDPLVERVSLTVDAANLELMRVDQILENVGDVTTTVSKATNTIDNVTQAPLKAVTSMSDKVRKVITPGKGSDEAARLAAGVAPDQPAGGFAGDAYAEDPFVGEPAAEDVFASGEAAGYPTQEQPAETVVQGTWGGSDVAAAAVDAVQVEDADAGVGGKAAEGDAPRYYTYATGAAPGAVAVPTAVPSPIAEDVQVAPAAHDVAEAPAEAPDELDFAPSADLPVEPNAAVADLAMGAVAQPEPESAPEPTAPETAASVADAAASPSVEPEPASAPEPEVEKKGGFFSRFGRSKRDVEIPVATPHDAAAAPLDAATPDASAQTAVSFDAAAVAPSAPDQVDIPGLGDLLDTAIDGAKSSAGTVAGAAGAAVAGVAGAAESFGASVSDAAANVAGGDVAGAIEDPAAIADALTESFGTIAAEAKEAVAEAAARAEGFVEAPASAMSAFAAGSALEVADDQTGQGTQD